MARIPLHRQCAYFAMYKPCKASWKCSYLEAFVTALVCVCGSFVRVRLGFVLEHKLSQHSLRAIQAAGSPDCSCTSLHETDADFYWRVRICAMCVCECVHVRWPLTVQELLCWPGSLDTKAVILAKTSTHTPHPSHICYSNSCQLRWTYTPYFLFSPFPLFLSMFTIEYGKNQCQQFPHPLPCLFCSWTIHRDSITSYTFFNIPLISLSQTLSIYNNAVLQHTKKNPICASSLKSLALQPEFFWGQYRPEEWIGKLMRSRNVVNWVLYNCHGEATKSVSLQVRAEIVAEILSNEAMSTALHPATMQVLGLG